MNSKPIPTDTQFGRLTVIRISDRYKKGHSAYYDCRCECGNVVSVRGDTLRCGDSKSCGCIHDKLLREKSKKAYDKNFKDGTNIPKLKFDSRQSNNTSGVPGVSWHKKSQKWWARIQFMKTPYSLGFFDNIEDASKAYKRAKEELHRKYLEEKKNT